MLLTHDARRPAHGLAHRRRHLDVEEQPVAFEPVAACVGRAGELDEIGRDTLQLLVQAQRRLLHRLLEHAFHDPDLVARVSGLLPAALGRQWRAEQTTVNQVRT